MLSASVGKWSVDVPRIPIVRPSEILTNKTALVSMTWNDLNFTPTANQRLPRLAGRASRIDSKAPMGSSPNPFKARIKGLLGTSLTSGRTNCRLSPRPPAKPVTKNIGGPPIGKSSAAITKQVT